MPTIIAFSRSDGDTSQWPSCGLVEPGVYLEHLALQDDYTTHFLERLALRLSDLLNYPRTSHSRPPYQFFDRHRKRGLW
jgi:hypothetical protein